MTLAIAAEFPWGEHRRVLDSFPLPHRFEGAIILAADTRWSYRDGSHRDNGRKLWILGHQVGLVFAGDVFAAEEGVRRLRDAGQGACFTGPGDVTELAARVFADTYAAHQESAARGDRAACGSVHYLMGFVDRAGGTTLARLSSNGGFRPIFLRGVHAIGVPRACDSARQELDRLTKNEGFNADQMPWALHIVGVIDSLVRAGGESTVGGKVQWVVGSKDGWSQYRASMLDPGLVFEPDNWREGSERLEDLKSVGSFSSRWLASSETDDLAVIRLSD